MQEYVNSSADKKILVFKKGIIYSLEDLLFLWTLHSVEYECTCL